MAQGPTISVVVPAYNAEKTVGATVSGLLDQVREPQEIVVVDDGSTDRTADIMRAYGPRVTLVTQTNGGCAAARNTAVRRATGDLVAWVDADDQVLPGYLSAMAQTWQRAADPRTIVCSDAYLLTPEGITGRRLLTMRHPRPERQALEILRQPFVSVFALYPRRLHDELGPLDESLRYGEDRDLWVRALHAGWHVVRQPAPLAIYRWTGGSASTNRAAMSEAEEAILAKAEATPGLGRSARDYLELRRRVGSPRELVSNADEALRAGDRTGAAAALRDASRLRPADRRLRLRALAAATPLTWPLLRAYQSRADHRLGYHAGMRR